MTLKHTQNKEFDRIISKIIDLGKVNQYQGLFFVPDMH